MPPRNTLPIPPSIAQGDAVVIVSAEQLGTGNFSQQVNIQDVYGASPRPVVLTFKYASTPAAVEYDIYVSMGDDSSTTTYTNVGKTTNVNGDQVTLQRNAAGGNMFNFVMVKEVTSPGVNATVTARQ